MNSPATRNSPLVHVSHHFVSCLFSSRSSDCDVIICITAQNFRWCGMTREIKGYKTLGHLPQLPKLLEYQQDARRMTQFALPRDALQKWLPLRSCVCSASIWFQIRIYNFCLLRHSFGFCVFSKPLPAAHARMF